MHYLVAFYSNRPRNGKAACLMDCPQCLRRARCNGTNRNGSQRYRCEACQKSFTDENTRPRDRRILSPDKTVFALRMLLEGNSIRSTERLLCIHRDTILSKMVDAGVKCKAFLERTIRNIPVKDVEVDELWGFCHCKQKLKLRRNYGEECGDAYCFLGVERNTKLILSWYLGKRDLDSAAEFCTRLRRAVRLIDRLQLTTDGFEPYLASVRFAFGPFVDYATLAKKFGPSGNDHKYSPPVIKNSVTTPLLGNPDPDRVCSSIVERSNLTLRMQIRRLTRLTNGYSKKWENHEAMLTLFFAYFNFCRVHSTIRATPAMKSGLADQPWSVATLLRKIA